MSSSRRILSWNLQGARGVDVRAVGRVIRTVDPDVVVLQEVQRLQARRLAADLAMAGVRWAFKHWPVVARAEGLAVLSAHPLAATDAFVVRRAPHVSWRRRIALAVTVAHGAPRTTAVDVHLSPHRAGRRAEEIGIVLARLAGRAAIIAGDLNDEPGGPAPAALMAAGWRDAWVEAGRGRDDGGEGGATNWTPGPRAGRPPTQRLDYIFVPATWSVADCAPLSGGPGLSLDHLGGLSDHLPLVATVTPPTGGDP